jgi:hypothetical protein
MAPLSFLGNSSSRVKVCVQALAGNSAHNEEKRDVVLQGQPHSPFGLCERDRRIPSSVLPPEGHSGFSAGFLRVPSGSKFPCCPMGRQPRGRQRVPGPRVPADHGGTDGGARRHGQPSGSLTSKPARAGFSLSARHRKALFNAPFWCIFGVLCLMSYIRLFQKTPPDFEIFGVFVFFAPFWCVFAFGGLRNERGIVKLLGICPVPAGRRH